MNKNREHILNYVMSLKTKSDLKLALNHYKTVLLYRKKMNDYYFKKYFPYCDYDSDDLCYGIELLKIQIKYFKRS